MPPKSIGKFDLNSRMLIRPDKYYDWYIEFPEFKPHYYTHSNQDQTVLMVGCGNSSNFITRNE